MKYLNPEELKKYLDIFLFVDAALIPAPEDAWLRLISSEISENDALWYLFHNGGGDEMQICFSENAVMIKGFDHENELNQFARDLPDADFFPHLYRGVPEELLGLFTEDELETATFFMWYLNDTGQWYQNEFPDNDGGKACLLGYIAQSAEEFLEWAQEYYEGAPVDAETIQKLYTSGTFTREDALKLNPECNPDSILAELH